MSSNLHGLVARMADELDYYRQLLMDDRREVHALAVEARAALSMSQPPTFLDAIRLAKGSHDYSGGYGSTPCAEAFHAGIDTVVNVLTKAATGPWDYQTKAVFQSSLAEPQPPADGEVGELVAQLRRLAPRNPVGFSRYALTRAADLLERLAQDHFPGATKMVEPIPVTERLPEAGDCDAEGRCWGFHPCNSEDDNVWHSWSLVPSRLLPSSPSWIGWDYWLPAHALPVPTTEAQP